MTEEFRKEIIETLLRRLAKAAPQPLCNRRVIVYELTHVLSCETVKRKEEKRKNG